MPQIIVLCARQVLRKEADIDRDKDTYSSAEVYVEELEATEFRKRLGMWEIPDGPPLT